MALKVKAKAAPPKVETKAPKVESKPTRPRINWRDTVPARFLREIRAELRKVVWPSRQEAINLTILVVAVSAAVGLALGGIDYIFRKIFELLIGF